MTTDLLNKISIKLFAGCDINSEIRMHLTHSIQWKHAALTSSKEGLQIACYKGKNYFGFYLEQKKLTLNELKEIQQTIRKELKIYCPDLEIENIKICIFPQVFIA